MIPFNNMLSTQNFRKLLIFSGCFNILFAFPLVIPGLANLYLELFSSVNSALGWGGVSFVEPVNPLHSLLINTAGIDLVLIGTVILFASRNPLSHRGIIWANGVGRLIFALIISYYVLSQNLLRIVILFGVIDMCISLGFVLFLLKFKGLGLVSPTRQKDL